MIRLVGVTVLAALPSTVLASNAVADGDGYGVFGTSILEIGDLAPYKEVGQNAIARAKAALAGFNGPPANIEEAVEDYAVLDDMVMAFEDTESLMKSVAEFFPSGHEMLFEAVSVRDVNNKALKDLASDEELTGRARAAGHLLNGSTQTSQGGLNQRQAVDPKRVAEARVGYKGISVGLTRVVSPGQVPDERGLEGLVGWEEYASVKALREVWRNMKDSLMEASAANRETVGAIENGMRLRHVVGRDISLEDALDAIAAMAKRFLDADLSFDTKSYRKNEFSFLILVSRGGEVRGRIFIEADPSVQYSHHQLVRPFLKGKLIGAAFMKLVGVVVTNPVDQATEEVPLRAQLRGMRIPEHMFQFLASYVGQFLNAFLNDVEFYGANVHNALTQQKSVSAGLFELMARDWLDAKNDVSIHGPLGKTTTFRWYGFMQSLVVAARYAAVAEGRVNCNVAQVLGETDPDLIAVLNGLASDRSQQVSLVERIHINVYSEFYKYVTSIATTAMIHARGDYRQKIYTLVDTVSDVRRTSPVELDSLVLGEFNRLTPSSDEEGLNAYFASGVSENPEKLALSIVPGLAQRLSGGDALEEVVDYSALKREIGQ